MKTQTSSTGKRTNHNHRGEKGSTLIQHTYPAIDLNWRRMKERPDSRGRYAPNGRIDLIPAISEVPTYINLGPIFGYSLCVGRR